MGVRNLWRLLLPIGRQVSIETLTLKILAIDSSIWLTQFLKAMRDEDSGRTIPYAHLIGFLRRICKLLYHGIKPVFVFDGATPEIKRRELAERRKRRNDGEGEGEGEVKRMARRILVGELKKMRLRRNGGLMTQEEEEDGDEEGVEERGEDEEFTQNEPTQDEPTQDEPTQEEPTQEQLTQDQLTQDQLTQEQLITFSQTETLQTQNDWDTPLPPSTPPHTSSSPTSSIDIPHSPTTLSPTTLLSLPQSTRSEIFAKAQKQQRLRNRNEFMPVAANPKQYSQVQLKNFLRVSQLNRIMVDVAQKAGRDGGEEGEEEGERMASDATRRIVFVKDDERKGRLKRLKRKREEESESESEEEHVFDDEKAFRQKQTFQNQDDESEEEEEEGVGFMMNSPKQQRQQQQQQTISIEDSNDHDGGFVSEQQQHSDSKQFQQENLEEEEEYEEGGFMMDDDDSPQQHQQPETNSNNSQSDNDHEGGFISEKQHLDDKLIQHEISSGDEEEGGGFIVDDDDSPQQQQQTISNEDNINDGGFIAEQEQEQDKVSKEHQILQDEMLAKALHSVEDEDHYHINVSAERNQSHTESEHQVIDLESDEDEVDDGKRKHHGDSIASNNQQPTHGDKSLAKNDEYSDSDEVDWEDGNDANTNQHEHNHSHDKQQRQVDIQEVENTPTDDDSEDDVNWEDGDNDDVNDTQEIISNPNEIEVLEPTNVDHRNLIHESDESDIHWEDGNDNGETFLVSNKSSHIQQEHHSDKNNDKIENNHDHGQTNDHLQKKPATKSLEIKFESEEPVEQNDLFPASMFLSKELDNDDNHHNAANHSNDDDDDDDNNNNRDSKPFDAKTTAAAFQLAQQTASNLTNWAGRAVRRAIAEHVQSQDVDQTTSLQQNSEDEEEEEEEEDDDYHRQFSINEIDEDNNDDHHYPSTQISPTQPNPTSLHEEEQTLQSQLHRQQRDAETFTDEMKDEIITLLQLFGIPYLHAPAEAEAQCVKLEQLGLVDGIVTEDSDVFVFGGHTIYKNMFADLKNVEVYMARDAHKEMGLGWNQMVALAMLLGGDYTEGVKGVGIVNGMEILRAFLPVEDEEGDVGVKEGLTRFRKWLDGFDPEDIITTKGRMMEQETSSMIGERQFHIKHKSARNRWIAPKDFPADNVLNAYTNPVVDASKSKFSWGVPDLERIQSFCQSKMGWTKDETDRLVLPVIRAIEGRRKDGGQQTRIESYFMRYGDHIKFADVRSKRLKDVLKDVQSETKKENEKETPNTKGDDNNQKKKSSESQNVKSKTNVGRRRTTRATTKRRKS